MSELSARIKSPTSSSKFKTGAYISAWYAGNSKLEGSQDCITHDIHKKDKNVSMFFFTSNGFFNGDRQLNPDLTIQ